MLYSQTVMNRLQSLRQWCVVALLPWFSVALAHQEPVRVLALFPTAASSLVQVNLLGDLSASALTGAVIHLEIKRVGSADPVQEIKLKEVVPGKYEANVSVSPGSYQISVVDRTFPLEALRYTLTADLPRPPNLNVASWTFPATKSSPAPTNTALLAVIGLPVLAIFGFLVVFFLRMCSKPSTDQGS
jgi:hypothetical protein